MIVVPFLDILTCSMAGVFPWQKRRITIDFIDSFSVFCVGLGIVDNDGLLKLSFPTEKVEWLFDGKIVFFFCFFYSIDLFIIHFYYYLLILFDIYFFKCIVIEFDFELIWLIIIIYYNFLDEILFDLFIQIELN